MKQNISKKLTISIFIVCILYIAIFAFSKIDSIQKQNDGKLGADAKAAYVCPSGYVEIADFCIQSDLQGDDSWYDAAKECAEDEDARLCKGYELMAACQAENNGTSFNDDIDGGGWEWADDMADNNQALIMFRNPNGCRMTERDHITGDSNDFRCCVNRY